MSLMRQYLELDQVDLVQVMYVWIHAKQGNLRCKTKTMNIEPKDPKDCPVWNCGGPSTDRVNFYDSDVYLHPVALFRDPFRGGRNKLLLCESYYHDNKPTATNTRESCNMVMERKKNIKPWFGIKQEYTFLDESDHPYGWPKGGFPAFQGPYYCGVGTNNVFGREIVEAHYRACLYAGIKVCATNSDVMPSQWEFHVGPCEGIEMGDQLWMARFILHRIAEDFGVCVSFDPKPLPLSWKGSGAHTTFSTLPMREEGGIVHIHEAIEKLSKVHDEHIKAYHPKHGADNFSHLTGRCQTADINTFSYGIADREASVRIPRQCAETGRGYFEDRRPPADADPYKVTERIALTGCES